MNYFDFHIGDYAAATQHLSDEEDLAYRRLLDAYYRDERPIPADIRQACRLARARTDAMREAVETVLREFFTETPDGWRSKRADEVIERHHAFIETQRNKGRASAAARLNRNPTAVEPLLTVQAAAVEPVLNRRSTGVQPPTSHFPLPTSQSGSNEPDESAAAPAARSKPARATKARVQIPDGDWLTDSDRTFATDRCPDMDIAATFDDFRNHHRAKGTLGADWHAGWRTWVGNCLKGFPYVRRVSPVAAVEQPKYSPAQWRELQEKRRAAAS